MGSTVSQRPAPSLGSLPGRTGRRPAPGSVTPRPRPRHAAVETDPSGIGVAASRRWTRGAATLTVASVAMGLANYVAALAMTRLVSAHEFSRYTAGQSLLLVLGTGSMAALPWAVSRFLVSPEYSRSRSEAMHFGLVGSLLQGAVLGGLALVVASLIDGPAFGVAVGAAAFAISLLAGPIGYFQGDGRLGAIAGLRLLETAVRIAIGIGLVVTFRRSATVGLLGFTAGSLIAFAVAIWLGRAAFPLRKPSRAISLALTRQALSLGAVQVLLAMLAALDTVYVTVADLSSTDAASYQAAAVIGRIPLFVSAALCTAAYPAMVAARGEKQAGQVLGVAIRQFAWLTLPFVVACVTIPHEVIYRVIPTQYSQAQGLLQFTCVLGALVGAINIVTTAHQARTFYRSAITVLGIMTAVQAVALLTIGQLFGVTAFAAVGVAVLGIGLVLLAVDGRRWLTVPRPQPTARGAVVTVLVVALLVAPENVPLWFAGVTLLGLCCLTQVVRPSRPRPDTAPTTPAPRV